MLSLFYIYTLLNKLPDDFFLLKLITESIVMQAMQEQCILSFGTLLFKKFVFISRLYSLTLVIFSIYFHKQVHYEI